MRLINRFVVLSKRILKKKLYISMLLILIVSTVIYHLLPEKEQSTDIRVGVYCEDTSDYATEFSDKLLADNSLYKFYFTDSKQSLLSDIQSGKAECGYIIPDNFFAKYIKDSNTENKIILYTLPSTTLGAAITETFFNNVLYVCSNDILINSTDLYDYRDTVTEKMSDYLSGDEIFRMSDLTNGEYNYETMTYKVNIPIYEISILLILFSGLLGLYSYIQDAEKSIYIALKKSELFVLRSLYIITAMLPVTFTGIICMLISSYSINRILNLVLTIIFTYIFSLILSVVIRKSTLLSKVLPIIVFIALVVTFILSFLSI
ncbi:MAG: hypothetical protein IJV15_01590 [Lachnospiraceae bacterium]|nr:hypothetical protein [Lachnospiraceae bacterium]